MSSSPLRKGPPSALRSFLRTTLFGRLNMRPSLLIVGAQKAATTSLYRYLTLHPEVVPNRNWKEVHFFDSPDALAEGPGRYWRSFPRRLPNAGKQTLEATPEYLYFPWCPALINRYLPEVKILISLREPASRAVSAWRMHRSFSESRLERQRALRDDRSFLTAVEQERRWKRANAGAPFYYLDRGRYAEQVERYLSEFGPERVCVTEVDEFAANPIRELNRMFAFWGLPRLDADRLQRELTRRHNAGDVQEGVTPWDSAGCTKSEFLQVRSFFKEDNERLFDLLGRCFCRWQKEL